MPTAPPAAGPDRALDPPPASGPLPDPPRPAEVLMVAGCAVLAEWVVPRPTPTPIPVAIRAATTPKIHRRLVFAGALGGDAGASSMFVGWNSLMTVLLHSLVIRKNAPFLRTPSEPP